MGYKHHYLKSRSSTVYSEDNNHIKNKNMLIKRLIISVMDGYLIE